MTRQQSEGGGPQGADAGTNEKKTPKRINVAVTPETVKALQLVMDQEGVSLTEAVRRLVGYGEFVYKAVKVDKDEVLIKGKDSTREVVFLA